MLELETVPNRFGLSGATPSYRSRTSGPLRIDWDVSSRSSSKLEVDRKLQLPTSTGLNRAGERLERRQQQTVHTVHLCHVRSIQDVERFQHEVELAVRLDPEVLQETDVERRGRG